MHQSKSDLYAPLRKARNAGIIIFCHLMIAGMVATSMYLLELLLHSYRMDGMVLFGWFPLAWVFQCVDLLIFGVFAYHGILEAHRVMR